MPPIKSIVSIRTKNEQEKRNLFHFRPTKYFKLGNFRPAVILNGQFSKSYNSKLPIFIWTIDNNNRNPSGVNPCLSKWASYNKKTLIGCRRVVCLVTFTLLIF